MMILKIYSIWPISSMPRGVFVSKQFLVEKLPGVVLSAYIEDMTTSKKPPFADRLRELRDKAGLTQAQLAERAGLHLSAVTRFEQGLREPSWSTAQSLADALGVSCEELRKPPVADREPAPRGRPPKSAPADKPKPPKRKGKS